MSKNGTIGVTTDNIFPIIKKFLYSDHEIFLREIVSNAVDATQKLKTLISKGEASGEVNNLKVYVSVNKEEGTLTISDRGIGMTQEEVEKYINQIAFSSATEFLGKYKDDANAIIGHFGLGFYSAFMVSKKVEIKTKSYKADSQAVLWSCDGSPEYNIEDVDKDTVGTDIILYIDDENKKFLEDNEITQLLNKYCKFLPVPIVFGKKTEWKDGKSVETEEDNQINDTNPLWVRKPTDLTDEDYIKFYHQLYPMADDPMFWIHLNVDYPFNLTGILYFPKVKSNIELQKNKIQLYCNQVYVTDSVEGIVPEFLTLLHGVIDSPDIPLNVSRSYLQSDLNVKKISTYITKKVGDRLDEIFRTDRTQFEEKWGSLKMFVEYGMLTDEKFFERSKKFFLLSNINNKLFTLDEYKLLIEANQTDKDGKLVYLYANNAQSQYGYSIKAEAKGYDVLLLEDYFDVHIAGLLERTLENSSFVRVDSAPVEDIILKEESKQAEISDAKKEEMNFVLLSQLPITSKQNFTLEFKHLGETSDPLRITQNEMMRRMKDMSALQPGMAMFGEMPDQYSLVVNLDQPIIKNIMAKVEGKKEDEIAKINADNSEIKELVDLTLLSAGMLKGADLHNFVERSIKNLKG